MPAEHAVEDLAYHYAPSVDFAGHRVETLRLTQAPAGAALRSGVRPEARELNWTPSHAQGGAQAFLLQAQLGEDLAEQRFFVHTTTRTKLATVTLGPDGATQTLSDTGTFVDGMTLSVPAGALSSPRALSVYRVAGPMPTLWPGQQRLFFPLVLSWDDAAGLPAEGVRVNLSLPIADSAIPAGFERSGLRLFNLMAPVSHAGHGGATAPMPLTLIDDPATVGHLTAHLMLAADDDLIQTAIGSYYGYGDGPFPIYWARADDDPSPEQINAYLKQLADDLTTTQAKAQSLGCRAVGQLDAYVASLTAGTYGRAARANAVFAVNKTNVTAADAAVAAAHEYFHLIQYSYARWPTQGFHGEAQATHFEDLVFDTANLYRGDYVFGPDTVEFWLNSFRGYLPYRRVTYYQHLKTRGQDNPCQVLQAGYDYAGGQDWPDDGWAVALEQHLGSATALDDSLLHYAQGLSHFRNNRFIDEIQADPPLRGLADWGPQQLPIEARVGAHQQSIETLHDGGGQAYILELDPLFFNRELELRVEKPILQAPYLGTIQPVDDAAVESFRFNETSAPPEKVVSFTAPNTDALLTLIRRDIKTFNVTVTTSVTVRAPTFIIRGQVTDASGQPAANTDMAVSYAHGELPEPQPVTTDEAGNYEVEVFANLGTITLTPKCDPLATETNPPVITGDVDVTPPNRNPSTGERPDVEDADIECRCLPWATTAPRTANFPNLVQAAIDVYDTAVVDEPAPGSSPARPIHRMVASSSVGSHRTARHPRS